MRRSAAALLLALAVGLTACTRVADAPRAGGHPWTQADHLRIASSEEPDSLDPLFANSDAAVQVMTLLYAPVLRYDADGDQIPELATVVPTRQNGGISRDGKTIVLHFRRGVTWSDGASLDARDFRFTWQAVMNPRNATRTRAGWDDVTAIDLPDPYTAVVRLREPYAAILGTLGSAPLPAHLLARLPDLNRASFNQLPISSGPYRLTAWNHGASLELAANARYWRGSAKIARISYRIIPNADTIFSGLQAHEIDVDDSLTEDQLARTARLEGYTITRQLSGNYRHLTFNCSAPLLRDVRVRRAIAEAVDWDRMNQTIYHGTNVRATSDIVPGTWAAPVIPPFPFDLAGARALLDAAGWRPGPDGIRRHGTARLSLTISTTVAKPANIQAEVLMQQQLRAAGIELIVRNYPTSLLFARNGPLYSGRYDLSLTIDTNPPDPDNETVWSGAFIPPHGANTTFLDDPVITATSHEAAHVYDRARRKALYQREEQRIHDLVPTVFLYWQVAHAAVNSDLKNYRPAKYVSNNWNAWEWEL